MPGKLPQRKIAQTAAAGYSSYGNQIGLATGLVSEIYHPGYVAKHLEVRRRGGRGPGGERASGSGPQPGDVVHPAGRPHRPGRHRRRHRLLQEPQQEVPGRPWPAEVQKGNAPEERKIQRLFRNGEVTRLIKRCNDFGAGGVSVAIGELADGLDIDLDAVRKKYDGLDGTELAISESQERMAVVVAAEDADTFIAAAQAENLEAYRGGRGHREPPDGHALERGRTIADLSREFLNYQRRGQAHRRLRAPSWAAPSPPPHGGTFIRKVRVRPATTSIWPPSGALWSGSTPPSARAPC